MGNICFSHGGEGCCTVAELPVQNRVNDPLIHPRHDDGHPARHETAHPAIEMNRIEPVLQRTTSHAPPAASHSSPGDIGRQSEPPPKRGLRYSIPDCRFQF